MSVDTFNLHGSLNMQSSNTQANLPANLSLHKAMEANRPSMLSNIANGSKRFFRFTLDIIERVLRRIFSKNTTGPSSIQKAISIRTISAKHMLNNASLPLGGNKNLRAHRASLKEMLDIHPDATAVFLYQCAYNHLEDLSPDNQKKCISSDLFPISRDIPSLKSGDIFYIVNSMLYSIEEQKEDEFNNNEEIKIILETPSFIVSENSPTLTAQDCAYAYITACEAWMLHLQKKYNKNVTILPFRVPENIENTQCKQLAESDDNAYDIANETLAKMNEKDRENELLKYINDHRDYMIDGQSDDYDDEGNIIKQQDPSTPTISSSPSIQNSKIALENENPSLLRLLHNIEEILEEAKIKGGLNDVADHVEEAHTSCISMPIVQYIIDPVKKKVVPRTAKRISAYCYNSESEEQLLRSTNFVFPDIDKDDRSLFPECLDIAPVVKIIGSSVVYTWDLPLTDYQRIAKFAKDNHKDLGEEVIKYSSRLGGLVFDAKTWDAHADKTKKYLDPRAASKIKNAVYAQGGTVYYNVNLNFPKEFLTGFEQSKNRVISSLAQQYGPANLILAAIENARDNSEG